jgi:hypothetical protein
MGAIFLRFLAYPAYELPDYWFLVPPQWFAPASLVAV